MISIRPGLPGIGNFSLSEHPNETKMFTTNTCGNGRLKAFTSEKDRTMPFGLLIASNLYNNLLLQNNIGFDLQLAPKIF